MRGKFRLWTKWLEARKEGRGKGRRGGKRWVWEEEWLTGSTGIELYKYRNHPGVAIEFDSITSCVEKGS